MPPPSSAGWPAERPTSGAIAAYERAVPNSDCSIEAYALEGLVLPVEAARALGDGGERRDEDRLEECVVPGRPEPRVGVREDRRGRLATEVVDGVASVREAAEGGRLLGHERAHERAILVERRPVPGRMLLEGERQLGAALGGERCEAERAQGLVEVRCPDRHGCIYETDVPSPTGELGDRRRAQPKTRRRTRSTRPAPPRMPVPPTIETGRRRRRLQFGEAPCDVWSTSVTPPVRPVVEEAKGIPFELAIEGSSSSATATRPSWEARSRCITSGVTFSTGEEFDASWNRGEPFRFTLGRGHVIPGWDAGVAGMTRRRPAEAAAIPSAMAYGARGAGGVIEPHEPLVFVVDLLAVD